MPAKAGIHNILDASFRWHDTGITQTSQQNRKNMHYPWQAQQWQQLMQAKNQHRLPHALLFTGITGTGKTHFADTISRALVCQQPGADGHACNQCHACHLVEGRAHPDVRWIEPEKVGHAIKVDQIRELSEFVQQSTFKGSRRVVLINPANNLNLSASNALLKTLEEPADGAILILISDQRDRLLPTILSRCQTVIFSVPEKQQAMTWLQSKLKENEIDPKLLLNLTHGAPVAALQLAKEGLLEIRADVYQTLCALKKHQADPIKAAARWKDLELSAFLDLMLNWLMDLSRLRLVGGGMINVDFHQALTELSQVIAIDENFTLINYVMRLRKAVSQGINLNKQLMLEAVLIRWAA